MPNPCPKRLSAAPQPERCAAAPRPRRAPPANTIYAVARSRAVGLWWCLALLGTAGALPLNHSARRLEEEATPRPTMHCADIVFSEHVISSKADWARSVVAADLDGKDPRGRLCLAARRWAAESTR